MTEASISRRMFRGVGFLGLAYLLGKIGIAASAHEWEHGFEYAGWEAIAVALIVAAKYAIKGIAAFLGEDA